MITKAKQETIQIQKNPGTDLNSFNMSTKDNVQDKSHSSLRKFGSHKILNSMAAQYENLNCKNYESRLQLCWNCFINHFHN